jgi:hypothetical protein
MPELGRRRPFVDQFALGPRNRTSQKHLHPAGPPTIIPSVDVDGGRRKRWFPRPVLEMWRSTYWMFGGLKARNDPEITKDKTDWRGGRGRGERAGRGEHEARRQASQR